MKGQNDDHGINVGDRVVLTRPIPGAVKGARATVVSVHAKPLFSSDAYTSSEGRKDRR